MGQVNVDPVEIIGPEGTARTTLIPIGSVHEVIHNELTLVGKQVGQRLNSLRALEFVVFLDPDPRQLTTFLRECVARFGKRFFFAEKLLPSPQPVYARYDGLVSHVMPLFYRFL